MSPSLQPLGYRVPTATTERRLSAIVAADVVGYTRLMAADEAATLAAFKDHRASLIDPAIARHRGHIVKTTGDGLLLEFVSVVEAVACAIEIQRGMAERNRDVPADRRIVFRIGVNIGDVVAEDGDVFGDGVNLAARLEQAAEPGGICLSEDAWRQVRGKVDTEAVDGGEQRFKNVPRPVRVYRIGPPRGGAVPSPAAARGRRVRRWRAAAIAGFSAVVAAGAAGGIWYLGGREPPAGPNAAVAQRVAPSFPVVAVLPFANQTGEPEQDYLADGLTEELIGAIGRFHTLRVIGRNAVLSYKGVAAPRDDIVTRLGARYLLEGSVRGSDQRLRIAAQLTDARAGTVLWTDRFDSALTDILDVQEAIARQIAGKLATNINQMEMRRQIEQPKPNPGAHDLVLRARALGHSSSRPVNRRFRELMTRAIDMDQNYATAHALLAEAILAQVILGWTEFAEQDLARGQELARRAVALAPGEPDGHRVLGLILGLRGQYREARHALRRAIEINPSDASALAVHGRVLSYDGDLVGAIEALELAFKFDPTLDAVNLFDLSICYYFARRHEDALRIAERALARFPDFVMLNVTAAAASVRLGRTTEAARYVEMIRRRFPVFDAHELGSRYRNRAYGAYLREGLALAGLTSR